jgi:hypothetical protein
MWLYALVEAEVGREPDRGGRIVAEDAQEQIVEDAGRELLACGWRSAASQHRSLAPRDEPGRREACARHARWRSSGQYLGSRGLGHRRYHMASAQRVAADPRCGPPQHQLHPSNPTRRTMAASIVGGEVPCRLQSTFVIADSR